MGCLWAGHALYYTWAVHGPSLRVHGLLTGDPWTTTKTTSSATHCRPMGDSWAAHGRLTGCGWLPMWATHGLPNGDPWLTHGLPMDDPRVVHDQPMTYSCATHGPLPKPHGQPIVDHTRGRLMGYPWETHELPMRTSQGTGGYP